MVMPSLFDPGARAGLFPPPGAGGGPPVNRGRPPSPCTVPRQGGAGADRTDGCAAQAASVTWSLPAQALHAHLARRWLQSLLDLSWRDGDAVDRAVHVFGEIVSNAVEHAGGRMTVHVSVCGHALRCEVGDPSPRLPEPTDAAADDEHHRGLPLVRALLGAPPEIRRTPDGKVVAFTVRADGAPVAA